MNRMSVSHNHTQSDDIEPSPKSSMKEAAEREASDAHGATTIPVCRIRSMLTGHSESEKMLN